MVYEDCVPRGCQGFVKFSEVAEEEIDFAKCGVGVESKIICVTLRRHNGD
jgi:hypothetical protein